MKALYLICMLFFVFTSLVQAKVFLPDSFVSEGKRIVFTDWMRADYVVTYDLEAKKAYARAKISFEVFEIGHPVFDSVMAPTSIKLNGMSVEAQEIKTPGSETRLRRLSTPVLPGLHELEIELPLLNLVHFTDQGVRSSFWFSDLEDRRFLESYLPANLEYDQVKMSFDVHIKGKKVQQVIYTNGELISLSKNHYRVNFPDYFTSSSLYFHVVPEGAMKELKFHLKSIDGRDLPVTVYFGANSTSASLEVLRQKTTEIMQELEADYGPFPHPRLIVYQAGIGGMEYCGATMTELRALGHELFHSYFARGMMPANGNAGWIDEALASWRDQNYRPTTTLVGARAMSSRPYYTRSTATEAYTFGERFMGYLDVKLKEEGGLKPFMRTFVERHKFQPITIDKFIHEMSEFYGISLRPEFERFTYRDSKTKSSHTLKSYHQKMSLKELEKFL